jgi:hypothetical protein
VKNGETKTTAKMARYCVDLKSGKFLEAHCHHGIKMMGQKWEK